MRLGRQSIYAIVAMLLIGAPAEAATILARCGPSTGQSYYFEAGIVGPGQGGWKQDGFAGGRITVYINNQNQLDLLQKDSTGLKSYLKEGYKVNLVELSQQDRAFLISAAGANFIETYLFKVNDYGVGTLAWSASKVTPVVIRTSIMTAECGPSFAIER